MGEEKLNRIECGIKDYIKGKRKSKQSIEVVNAIEVLSSLGDFEEFKRVMLEWRNDGASSGSGFLSMDSSSTFSVEGEMDKIEMLNNEAQDIEGWDQVLDEPNFACFLKKTEGQDTLLRATLVIDMAPRHAKECFLNTTQDSLTWRIDYKSIEVVEETDENDKIVKLGISLPMALAYVFSFPEFMSMRFVCRPDFPEEGQLGYVIFPYDPEK